jgi:hypothetical protein
MREKEIAMTSTSTAPLLELGEKIRECPEEMIAGIAAYIRVRDRNGALIALEANEAQRAFENNAERSNIVLKARQMGLTTWIAARLFMKTITAERVLTVQVAHTREAAARCAAAAPTWGRCASRSWTASSAS